MPAKSWTVVRCSDMKSACTDASASCRATRVSSSLTRLLTPAAPRLRARRGGPGAPTRAQTVASKQARHALRPAQGRTLHKALHALLPQVEVLKLAVEVLYVRCVDRVELGQACVPPPPLLLRPASAVVPAVQLGHDRLCERLHACVQPVHLRVGSSRWRRVEKADQSRLAGPEGLLAMSLFHERSTSFRGNQRGPWRRPE